MSWKRNPADWPHDAFHEVTQAEIDMGRRIARVLLGQRLKAFGQEFFSNLQGYPIVLDPMGMGHFALGEIPPDSNEVPPETS